MYTIRYLAFPVAPFQRRFISSVYKFSKTGMPWSFGHAFNLVNIDPPNGIRRRNHGSVHLVDAYTNVLIPSYPNPTFRQSHNEMVRFAYRRAGYSLRVVNRP